MRKRVTYSDDGMHCEDGTSCWEDADCSQGSCSKRGGDGCDFSCREEVCGNGIRQSGEECDNDTTGREGDGCDAECVIEECGNDKVQIGEACDDGNLRTGDGCNRYCKKTELRAAAQKSSSSASSASSFAAPFHSFPQQISPSYALPLSRLQALMPPRTQPQGGAG